MDEYRDQGFQYVTILIEDTRGNTPDEADAMAWADQGGFVDIPVLTVKRNYEPWPFFERDWGIPTIAHVGPDMTVLSVDEGVSNPRRWL